MIAFIAATMLAQSPTPTPPLATGRSAVAGAPDTKATAQVSGADKVVCRQEQETGSLLGGHKTCLTQGQWDQMARDARDTTNAVTLMGNHRGGFGSGH